MNRRPFVVRSGCTVFGAPICSRVASMRGFVAAEPATRVFPWERGIAVASRAREDMAMFFWPTLAAIIPCLSPGLVGGNLNERHGSAEGLLRARDCAFVFSQKWPSPGPDATGGLIVRESTDGTGVSGIAWDDCLSVQAHNPWRCMHLAVRVGPLKRHDTRTIRGKLYPLEGTKEDCLRLYWSDFS